MKKRNKSYLLFLYGHWDDDNEFIRDIRDTLLLVVDSGYLKFVHGPSSAILSFKSLEDFSDILTYIDESLPKYIENYIFIPKPRKMGYRFPEDMSKHLFDLDTNTNDLIDKQNENTIKDLDFSIDDALLNNDSSFGNLDDIMGRIDRMFEDFVTDVKKITTNNQDFDLDSILDKITEKGVSSLTEEEREFLDNHNKNN